MLGVCARAMTGLALRAYIAGKALTPRAGASSPAAPSPAPSSPAASSPAASSTGACSGPAWTCAGVTPPSALDAELSSAVAAAELPAPYAPEASAVRYALSAVADWMATKVG